MVNIHKNIIAAVCCLVSLAGVANAKKTAMQELYATTNKNDMTPAMLQPVLEVQPIFISISFDNMNKLLNSEVPKKNPSLKIIDKKAPVASYKDGFVRLSNFRYEFAGFLAVIPEALIHAFIATQESMNRDNENVANFLKNIERYQPVDIVGFKLEHLSFEADINLDSKPASVDSQVNAMIMSDFKASAFDKYLTCFDSSKNILYVAILKTLMANDYLGMPSVQGVMVTPGYISIMMRFEQKQVKQ